MFWCLVDFKVEKGPDTMVPDQDLNKEKWQPDIVGEKYWNAHVTLVMSK